MEKKAKKISKKSLKVKVMMVMEKELVVRAAKIGLNS